MPDPSPAPLSPEELRELQRLHCDAANAWIRGLTSSLPVARFTVAIMESAGPRIFSELAALREENERLRSFTAHRHNCEVWRAHHNDDGELQSGPCSCGFVEAFAAPAQEAREG